MWDSLHKTASLFVIELDEKLLQMVSQDVEIRNNQLATHANTVEPADKNLGNKEQQGDFEALVPLVKNQC